MKKLLTVAVAALLSVATVGKANAAIEGWANLNITDFGLYLDTGGGGQGAAVEDGVHVSVLAATFSSVGRGDVASIPGIVSTGNFAIGSASGLDTPQAYEGNPPASAENDFSNYISAVSTPFARGDTTGAGSIIDGLADPFLASNSLVAEVELPTGIGNGDFGRADASSTSNGSIITLDFSVLSTIDLVGIFSASVNLLADLTPFPPGVVASADISYTISIRDSAGGIVFSWSPDGQGTTGTIIGGTINSNPFSLNDSVSAIPGGTSSTFETSDVFSASFTLNEGEIYSFTIDAQVAATATRNTIVPEPTTLAAWSLLSAAGMGVVWYRKRR